MCINKDARDGNAWSGKAIEGGVEWGERLVFAETHSVYKTCQRNMRTVCELTYDHYPLEAAPDIGSYAFNGCNLNEGY